MTHQVAASRRLPAPPAPLVPWRGVLYRSWSAVLRSWSRWRAAWLAVLTASLAATWVDPGGLWAGAAATWVVAGAGVTTAGRLVQAEAERRALEHETCGLPAIGPWRLAAEARDLDPQDLLLLDLLTYLHLRVRLVRRPIRGHVHGAMRTTYEKPLRALARDFGRDRGVGVRRADRLMHRLVERGVVHRITVSKATAYRLAHQTPEDALRYLERTGGRPLICWRLGRDPRADGWLGASAMVTEPIAGA